jgi:GH35 family endo-1,4-beta-xylanase
MQAIRSDNDTGEGLVSVAFQKEWDDRAFQSGFAVECDPVWRRQYVRAVAKRDYLPGEATLRFQLGFRPQTIRIADIRLLNFGERVEYAALPTMPLAYKGMEPEAAWRKEAWKRIEQHRKSDVTIIVTDAQGNAVPNAQVSLEQTRLAFGLGAAHSAKLYHTETFREELPTFQQNFDRLFNKAVLPNILKWKQYPRRGKAAVLPAYQWLSENEIPVRGHCIIWPGWRYLPDRLRHYENDPDTLRRLCEDRIDSLLADWNGKLAEWDVVNEVYMQDDLLEICGREILVDWFKQVRQLDPGANLYYNDANTLANHQPGHADHYYETIQWLLEQGAPVDGMGFQSHVHTLVAPEAVYRRIERFAELGPDIQITEFDIQVPDISEKLQAQYARDYLIAVFSHPKTVGVITWLGGMPLREIPTAHPDARAQCAFFREDWSIKPIGQMWLNLVEKEWKTKVRGSTDEGGKFRTRGFHGKYRVSVTRGRAQKTTELQLGEQSKTFRLVIDKS